MPISDFDDEIQSRINDAISSAIAPLNQKITSLEGRVTAVEDSSSSPDPSPEDPDPEPETVSNQKVVRTSTGLTYSASISGYSNVTLRVSGSPITTQIGWYYPTTVTNGSVSITTTAQNSTSTYYWQLEDGADRSNILASGQVGPFQESSPTPSPTSPGDMTGGSGGALTNRTFQSFTSNGITSQYHIYASGLDWSKKVGILIYGDGSGEYGLKNPTQSYLMAGTSGLIAVAKKHNMILLTPMAPGDGCTDSDGVCWYANSYDGTTPAQKTKWSFDLIQNIYNQYNIDKSRVAIGGYSSGAQWTSQFIVPAYGTQIMTDGVFIPISYGGAPRLTTTFTSAFKGSVVGYWDCGTSDSAYSTASYGAIGGFNWYRDNGFTVDSRWVSGLGHSRSGQFGGVMDTGISKYVKTA